MTRCTNCGSSAQLKILTTEYEEDGWTIEVVRTYICGCGQVFTGTSYYHCQECYEITEPIPAKLFKKKCMERVDKPLQVCYNKGTNKKGADANESNWYRPQN